MATTAFPRLESDRFRPIAARLHTVLVLALLAGWAYWEKIDSDQMRAAANPDRIGFYTRILLFEWFMFAIVVLGVRLNGSSLHTVLESRWRSGRELLRDIGIATGFWIVWILVLSIGVSHGSGTTATSRAVLFILPHGGAETALWVALSITAGICEEAIFRGYLQRQLTAMTKSIPLGILLSAVVFGMGHSYQGLIGVIRIGLGGVMLGILAHRRGSVRPGMIAHAWNDVFAGVLARLAGIRVG